MFQSAGCTVIGYQIGKDRDSRGYEPLHHATLREVKEGWDVRLTTEDEQFEGTVTNLLFTNETVRVVLQGPEGLAADTLDQEQIVTIERADQLGNPTAIGTMIGICADIVALWWIERKIHDAFGGLR